MKILSICLLLLLVLNVNALANPVDDSIKQSVKESIHDITQSTKDTIKESVVPNIDRQSFGTLLVKLMMIVIVGLLIMLLVSGIDELHMTSMIKLTIVLLCVQIIAQYINKIGG